MTIILPLTSDNGCYILMVFSLIYHYVGNWSLCIVESETLWSIRTFTLFILSFWGMRMRGWEHHTVFSWMVWIGLGWKWRACVLSPICQLSRTMWTMLRFLGWLRWTHINEHSLAHWERPLVHSLAFGQNMGMRMLVKSINLRPWNLAIWSKFPAQLWSSCVISKKAP